MPRNLKNPEFSVITGKPVIYPNTEPKTISLSQAMKDVDKLSSEDKQKLYFHMGKMFDLIDLEKLGIDRSTTGPILQYHEEEGARGKTKRKKRKHKKTARKGKK